VGGVWLESRAGQDQSQSKKRWKRRQTENYFNIKLQDETPAALETRRKKEEKRDNKHVPHAEPISVHIVLFPGLDLLKQHLLFNPST
jgi:hypothetical protein